MAFEAGAVPTMLSLTSSTAAQGEYPAPPPPHPSAPPLNSSAPVAAISSAEQYDGEICAVRVDEGSGSGSPIRQERENGSQIRQREVGKKESDACGEQEIQASKSKMPLGPFLHQIEELLMLEADVRERAEAALQGYYTYKRQHLQPPPFPPQHDPALPAAALPAPSLPALQHFQPPAPPPPHQQGSPLLEQVIKIDCLIPAEAKQIADRVASLDQCKSNPDRCQRVLASAVSVINGFCTNTAERESLQAEVNRLRCELIAEKNGLLTLKNYIQANYLPLLNQKDMLQRELSQERLTVAEDKAKLKNELLQMRLKLEGILEAFSDSS